MNKSIKGLLVLIAAVAIVLSPIACTDNQRAKSFGGTADVTVERGQKVIGATWKESHLWYLTRPMREDDKAEVVTLHESSSFGVIQGKVRFIEVK